MPQPFGALFRKHGRCLYLHEVIRGENFPFALTTNDIVMLSLSKQQYSS